MTGFGKVLIQFASAQLVSNFLRMVSGFLVVRLLDPEIYGQFTGVGIYLGYILLGHAGIINGLGRELPFELGRGNDKYSRELASTGALVSLGVSALAAIIFLGISIYYLVTLDYITGLIFFSYSIIGGLYLFNKQFLPVLYRTNKDFNSLSAQNIKIGIFNLLSVALVWFLGLYGLIIRGVMLSAFEFYLLYKNKPYKLQLVYNLLDLKKLFKTGLPIFLVGHVNIIWETLMNSIIFTVGGAVQFGVYAISSIVNGAIGIIPSAISQILYPRMSIMLGNGSSISAILNSNLKPVLSQVVFMSIVSTIGCILIPILIPIVLPKYIDGIEAAQWMIFVPVIQSFSAFNNIYNVVKKQFLFFIALVTGAVVGSLFVWWQIRTDAFYLEVFPQGMLLGIGIQQFLSLVFIRVFRKQLYKTDSIS